MGNAASGSSQSCSGEAALGNRRCSLAHSIAASLQRSEPEGVLNLKCKGCEGKVFEVFLRFFKGFLRFTDVALQLDEVHCQLDLKDHMHDLNKARMLSF